MGRKIGNKTEIFTVENGLPSNKVTNLYVDNIGVLWISTSAGAAFYDDSKFHSIKELVGEQIVQILQDADNGFWLATEKGLLRINSQGKETFMTTETGLPDNIIHRILEDSKGKIWLGSRNAGLIKMLPDNKYEIYNKKNGISSNFILAFSEAKNGDLLVSISDAGFCIL